MCLVVPPKKSPKAQKSAKPKDIPQAKPVAVPTIPTYSRVPPSKTCTSSATLPVCQAECLLEYAKEKYPGDSNTWVQYSHSPSLRHLDKHVQTQFDETKSATENVGKGVKAIQERLEQLGETLKGTDEAAKAAKNFGEETKKRRAAKADEQRKMKEEAEKRAIESLKVQVAKQGKEFEELKNKQPQKKGLDKADVRKLLDEQDTQQELGRLRGLHEGAASKHDAGCLRIVDLVNILDQRDHKQEYARLQALESQRAKDEKQDEAKTQEIRLREMMREAEREKEFVRLKAVEAETLKHGMGGHSGPGDTATVSLADVERLIEDMLRRHELALRFAQSHDTLGAGQRQGAQPAPAPDQATEAQRTIHQILGMLLQHRQIDKVAELLQHLLYKTEHDSRSDRHWILTEVLGYVEEYFLPGQHYDMIVKNQERTFTRTTCTRRLLLQIASPASLRQATGNQCALDLES